MDSICEQGKETGKLETLANTKRGIGTWFFFCSALASRLESSVLAEPMMVANTPIPRSNIIVLNNVCDGFDGKVSLPRKTIIVQSIS